MSNTVRPLDREIAGTETVVQNVCGCPSTSSGASGDSIHWQETVPANLHAAFCWPLLIMNSLGLTSPYGSFMTHDVRRRPSLGAAPNSRVRHVWRFFTYCGNVLSPLWTFGMIYAFGFIIYGLIAVAKWKPFGPAEIFAITACPWMLQQIMVSILFKQAWHRKKGGLFDVLEQWYGQTPVICVYSKQARHIAQLPRIVIGVGLILGAASVALSICAVFKLLPGPMIDLSAVLTPEPTQVEPYKSLIRYALVFGYVGAALYFAMITAFIVLVVFIISKEFERIAQQLEAAHDRRKRSLSIDIEHIRSLHQQVCKKVEKCDNAFHGILAAIFGCAIPVILFNLYQAAIVSGVARYSTLFWTGATVLQVLVISVACSAMHEQAHRPLDVLYDIGVGPEHGTALDTEEARLELLTFISKLTRTSIGLTVWRFVVVTREFIVSLTAYLLTLVIVIIQFQVKKMKEEAHIRNEEHLEDELAHLRGNHIDEHHGAEFTNASRMLMDGMQLMSHNVSTIISRE